VSKNKSIASRHGKKWSQQELEIALNAYIYMLQLEANNIPFSIEEMSRFLTNGPLNGRNAASVRYRMRNISYIFQERKIPILKRYSPASQVGSQIKDKIIELLDLKNPDLLYSNDLAIKKPIEISQKEIINKIEQLEGYLSEVRSATIGIGHNNPPEVIENPPIDFSRESRSLDKIKSQLHSNNPDVAVIKKERNVILELGLKLCTWVKTGKDDISKGFFNSIGVGITAVISMGVIELLKLLSKFIMS